MEESEKRKAGAAAVLLSSEKAQRGEQGWSEVERRKGGAEKM